MDGGHDPDCRKGFPWDESKWDHDLLAYVKEAVALRKDNPALRRGDHKRLQAKDGIYCYTRSLDGSTLIVALNASESPQQFEITPETAEIPRPVFGNASEISMHEGQVQFTVPPRSGAVLK